MAYSINPNEHQSCFENDMNIRKIKEEINNE